MKKARKKILWSAIAFVALFLLTRIELVDYLLMQASGQFEVLWNSRPIEEVLSDASTTDELRKKLLLIEEVKSFAKKDLDLESEGLYQTVYDQKGKDILWNLSACEPYMMQSVEWKFPIVGSVSYKGFFDLEKARQERKILKEKGYDTRIRPVNAWSTLGWFPDPILSNNLDRNKGNISELFIHEITHSNIFIKDSLTFNENLASFIGEQGARRFLIKTYGRDSREYMEYIKGEQDIRKFIAHCLKGLNELDFLYKGFGSNMSEEEKMKAKRDYLRGWVMALDTLTFFNEKRYHNRFENDLPNNAFFMAFERYDSKKIIFEKELENRFKGDLKAFVNFYKKLD